MSAALVGAADLGKRDTGWAMVLFSGSAICWLTGAVLARDWALGTQNVVLFAIDVFGVYRYLIRDRDG